MFVVFCGEGLVGLLHFGHDPIAFMVFAPLIFLFWGEIVPKPTRMRYIEQGK